MFRKIDPKAQANLIDNYVVEQGGLPKRTKTLEVVAKINGAPHWNALQGAKQVPDANEKLLLSALGRSSIDEALLALMLQGVADDSEKSSLLQKVQQNLAKLQEVADNLEHKVWQAMGFNRVADTLPVGGTQYLLECQMFDDEPDWVMRYPDIELDDDLMTAIREQGVVTDITVEFPRSDRYGVPEEATDNGAQEWLWVEGFQVSNTLEVNGEDRGDDGVMSCKIRIYLPVDLANRVHALAYPAK